MVTTSRLYAAVFASAALSALLTASIFQMQTSRSQGFLPSVIQSQDIPDVVEKVSPSVVSIVVSKNLPIIERRLREFGSYGIRIPVYVQNGTEEVEVGGGSGFFIREDGLIMTNKHVVVDEEALYTVYTNDGKRHDAEVVYRDSELDVALIKISGDYPHLEVVNPSEVRVGDTVIAIGNALAEFRNTVSVGIISGLGRSVIALDPVERELEELEEVIQTDAAINQGNSGGPLLDASGKVVGMNVAMSVEGQNIGFAIPASQLSEALARMR